MLSMDYFFSKEMVADKVGFELGYFSIFDDDKILYDGKRKQNFMLFLSIPDILLDLCDLIESKKKKKDIKLRITFKGIVSRIWLRFALGV